MAVLKYSRQREAIKTYLEGRTDHPTADMVYTAIREVYPNISLGTVYRNLTLLAQPGRDFKDFLRRKQRSFRCENSAPLPFYM